MTSDSSSSQWFYLSKKNYSVIIYLLLILFFVSCTSDEEKHIEIVKNGSFNEYPAATIGGILDNAKSFSKKEWTYLENKQGEKKVTFVGYFNTENNKFLKETIDLTVQMDFLFFANKNEFDIANAVIKIKRKDSFNQKFIDATSFDIDGLKNELYKNDLTKIFEKINNFDEFLNSYECFIIKKGVKKAIDEHSLDKLKQIKDFGCDVTMFTVSIPMGYEEEYVTPILYAFIKKKNNPGWKIRYNGTSYSRIDSFDITKAEEVYKIVSYLYQYYNPDERLIREGKHYFNTIISDFEYYKKGEDVSQKEYQLADSFIELMKKIKKTAKE